MGTTAKETIYTVVNHSVGKVGNGLVGGFMLCVPNEKHHLESVCRLPSCFALIDIHSK